MMGFARDGYLNTFPYKVNPGEKATFRLKAIIVVPHSE